MATKKKATAKKSSSGSDAKSKRIVKGKVGDTMHEFKQRKLSSGRSGKKVVSKKQAIAIGLSEARRSGANIPPSPNAKKKTATKKAATKKATKKAATKKQTGAKGAAKKTATKRK
jgi:hypothetical protein